MYLISKRWLNFHLPYYKTKCVNQCSFTVDKELHHVIKLVPCRCCRIWLKFVWFFLLQSTLLSIRRIGKRRLLFPTYLKDRYANWLSGKTRNNEEILFLCNKNDSSSYSCQEHKLGVLCLNYHCCSHGCSKLLQRLLDLLQLLPVGILKE